MTDGDSFKYVCGWSLGGLVASGLVIAAMIAMPEPPQNEVVTERAMAALDQQTCRQMLQTFVDQSRSGAQIIWLWAEESTPRVFGAGPWTKQQVDPAHPPRPYAFHPDKQGVPPEACSYPENSLHVVAVEMDGRHGAVIGAGIE